MKVSERIYQEVKELPEPLQAEVLDFIQYLASRAERKSTPKDELASENLSLSLAMRGMEDEDFSRYSTKDLREVF
jgi:hypothetical protein